MLREGRRTYSPGASEVTWFLRNGRYPKWPAAPPRHCAVHSGTALQQSDIAGRPVYWTYWLQVGQWLATLSGPRGSQEGGAGLTRLFAGCGASGEAGVLRDPFTPAAGMARPAWPGLSFGG